VLLQYFKCLASGSTSIIANTAVISSSKSGDALHEVVAAFLLICDALRDAKIGFFNLGRRLDEM